MRGQSSLSKLSEPQLMQPLKESTPKNNYYLSYNPSKHHANRSVGPYPESNNGSYTAAHNSHEVKHHYSISGSNNANENPKPAQKTTNQYHHRRNNSEPHPFIPNNQPADYGQRHHQYESTRDVKSKHSVEKLRDHSDSQLKTLLSPTNDKTSSKNPLYKKETNYSSAQIAAKQPRIHIDLSSILKPQVGNHIVRDNRAYKTSSQTSMLAAPTPEEIDKENRSVKANVTLFGNQRFPLNLKYGLPNPSAPQTQKNEEAPSIYSAYINMAARREQVPTNHQAEAQNYSLYNLGGTTTPVPPSARRTEGKPNVDHGVIKPPNRNTATDYTRGGHRRTASTSQIGDYPTSFYLNVSQRQEKSPEKANMSTSLCNFDDNIDPNQHNKFSEIAVNYPASSFIPSTPSSNLLYNPKDLQPPSLPTPKEMNKDKMSMNNILNKMTTSSSTRNRDLPRQIQPQNNQSSSRLAAPQSVQIQLEERQLDRRRNPEHDNRKEQRNARHASAIYEGQQNYSYKIEVDNSKSESMQAERKLMKLLNPESTRGVGVSESNSSLNSKHKRTKSMTEKLKSQSRILSKKKSFAEDFQKSIAEKDRSLGTEEGYGTDHSNNSVEKDDGQQQIREIKQIIHNQIEIKDAIDKERPCRIGSNLQETRIRGYPVDSLPLQGQQGQIFVRTRPLDDLRNDVNNSLKYHVKGDFSSRNNASIVRGKPVYINNSQNNIEEEKVESIGGGLSRGISTGGLHKGHNETKQAYKSQLRRNASQPEELRMFSNNQNSQDKIRTNLSVNYRDVDIKDKYSSERRTETPGIDILKGMFRPTENSHSRGSITLKERHENVAVTTANSSKIQGIGGITTERDGKENGEKGFWFGEREKNNSGTAVTKKTDRSSMNSLNVEKAKLSTTWDSHDHVFPSSNQYYIHRDAEKSRRTTQLNQSGTTQTTKRDTSKDGSSYIGNMTAGGRAERHIIEEEIEIEKKEYRTPTMTTEKIDIFKLHEQQQQQKMMIPEITVMGNTSNFLTENNTSLVDVGHREGTLIDRNPLLSSTELSTKDVFSGRKFESAKPIAPTVPTLNNYTTPTSQIHIPATNPVTAVTTPKVVSAPVNSARRPIEEKYQQPKNRPANIQSNYEKDYEIFKNTFSQRQTPITTPQNQPQNQKYSSTQQTGGRTQAPQRNQKDEGMVKNRLKDVLENRPLQISSTSNKSGSVNSKPQQTLQKSSSMRQYERSVEQENLEKQSQSGYSSKTDQIARHMRSKDAQLGGRTSKETSIEQQQMSKNEETPMTTMRPKEGLLSVRAMLEDLSNRKNSIKTPISELVSPQTNTKNMSMKEMFRSEYRKNDLKQQSREDYGGQKKDPLEEIDYLSSICSIDDEPEATMISDQIVDTVRILQGKKQEQMMKQKQAEIKDQYREAYSSTKVIRKTQEIRAEENPKCDQETKRRTRDHKSGGSIRDFEYLNNDKFSTNWSKREDFGHERNTNNKGNLEILTYEKSDFNLLATNRNKCDTSRSKRSSANHERNLESNVYQVYQTMSQKSSPMVRRSPIGFSRSSNKQLVKNALNNVCLAGEVNRKEREEVLARMDEVKDRNNFIIVFKESSGRQDFKALYYYDSAANLATKIYSNGSSPSVLDESMIANYYRYDSGSREFKNIADNKSLSIIVDAVGLNSFVTRRF